MSLSLFYVLHRYESCYDDDIIIMFSDRNSSYIMHKTCFKITAWGGIFDPIVTFLVLLHYYFIFNCRIICCCSRMEHFIPRSKNGIFSVAAVPSLNGVGTRKIYWLLTPLKKNRYSGNNFLTELVRI